MPATEVHKARRNGYGTEIPRSARDYRIINVLRLYRYLTPLLRALPRNARQYLPAGGCVFSIYTWNDDYVGILLLSGID